MSDKHLVNSLPYILGVVAAGTGVSIRTDPGATTASTNGKVINFPPLPYKGQELAIYSIGYLVHEAGHIRSTDFTATSPAISTHLGKMLINVLEDVRIERLINGVFPGARTWLDLLTLKFVETKRQGVTDPDADLTVVMLRYLQDWLYESVLGYPSLKGIGAKQRDLWRSKVSAEMADDIETLALQASWASTTTQVIAAAGEIIAILQKEQQSSQQQAQQSQQNQQSPSDANQQGQQDQQQSSGSSQDSDGETGEGDDSDDQGSSDAPTPSDVETDDQSDGSQVASGSADDSGDSDDAGDTGDAGDSADAGDAGESQASGNTDGGDDAQDASKLGKASANASSGQGDPSKDGQGEPAKAQGPESDDKPKVQQDPVASNIDPQAYADALNAMLQTDELEQGADRGDAIKQDMAAEVGISSAKKQSTFQFPTVMPLLPAGGDAPSIDRVKSASIALRYRMDDFLEANMQSRRRVADSGKRLVRDAGRRLALGDFKIFERRTEGQKIDTAVHVLLDISGSMIHENRYRVALDASLALGVALQETEGVNFSMSAFPFHAHDVVDVVLPGELVRDVASRAILMVPNGYTPLDKGLLHAHTSLMTTKASRRVCLVVTDGAPDDIEAAKLLISMGRDDGIEYLGIGICSSAHHITPESCVVNDLDELPKQILSMMQNVILLPKAA